MPINQPRSLTDQALHDLYTERLDRSKKLTVALDRDDLRIGNIRVALFALVLVILVLAFAHKLPWWTLSVPVVAFLFLVKRHDNVATNLKLERRRTRFYDHCLARIEDRWTGMGDSGSRYSDAAHPYSPDLDLFGDGSLYQLLSTCRTRAGQDLLAHWLTMAASPEEIERRQASVRELTSKLDLREDVALLGEAVGGALSSCGVQQWASVPAVPTQGSVALATGLAVVNIIAALYSKAILNALPIALSTFVTSQIVASRNRNLAPSVRAIGKTANQLDLLAKLLERIANESATSPMLTELQSRLTTNSVPAHDALAKLQKLVGFYDATYNLGFRPFLAIFIWRLQFSARIEVWRNEYGASLAAWIEAAGTFEALCALANFAFENPNATYPIIATGSPSVAASAIAHPLIPRSARVANDVGFGESAPLLIVSGSNMSGKSTLMRTVGVNAVLAYAGAPVIATSMTLTPLQIAASIRTSDSLQGGVSRFYAEILRIKQVVDLASQQPTLFLLDEILHGTNSHDRRVGSEAILRALVASGGIGIVTTHDLAIANLADDAALGAVNVHLDDQVLEDKIVFDYKLKPGIVEKSNAIALMRAVGLDV